MPMELTMSKATNQYICLFLPAFQSAIPFKISSINIKGVSQTREPKLYW